MPVKAQASFTGGELSPSLYSRVDVQKYQFGLRTCKNFFIHTHGGASNRPGLEFLYRRKSDSTASRNISFEFNDEQAYALEFGHEYMRVWKDGGLVLEAAKTVTNSYAENPLRIKLSASHSFSLDDWVYISGIDGDHATQLNGKYFKVNTIPAADEITLKNIDDAAINGTAASVLATTGSVSRVYEIATPYQEADLFELKYTQSNDTMTLTHPSYQDRELTRSGHASWTLTAITHTPGETAPGTPTATTGGGAGFTIKYRVTSVDAETGEESLSVESNSIAGGKPTSVGNNHSVVFTGVSGSSKHNVYRSDSSSLFGYVGSTVGGSGSITYLDSITNPDWDDGAPDTSARNPFSGADNYPSCATYYKQRKIFGANNNYPQNVWASRIRGYNNMNVSTPARADDSITMTLNSDKMNRIRHLVPLKRILVLTAGSMWSIGGDESGVFTYETANSELESEEGAAHPKPIVSSGSVLYVEEGTNHIKAAGYAFENDRYESDDMSLMASHLFDGYTIIDWAYQKSPYSLIWCVRSDGKMLCMSYQKKHQIWAWSLHETDGLFETVCAIPEDGYDAVYVGVKRKINGSWRRYQERFHSRDFGRDIRDAFFVDSGLTYDPAQAVEDISIAGDGKVTITITGHGYSDDDEIDLSDIVGPDELNDTRFVVADSTANDFVLKLSDGTDEYVDGSEYDTYESGGYARLAKLTFSGFDHLEGETIVALSDGGVEVDITVTSGQVTLKEKGSRVHFGLPYTCDLETLDLEMPEANSFGKQKAVNELHVKVYDTRGGKYGFDEDHLNEHIQREDEDWSEPTKLQNGEFSINIHSTWENSGRVLIRQAEPLPITILSIMPDVTIS